MLYLQTITDVRRVVTQITILLTQFEVERTRLRETLRFATTLNFIAPHTRGVAFTGGGRETH